MSSGEGSRSTAIGLVFAAFTSSCAQPAQRNLDTAFADTVQWSRVTAVSAPVSLLVPPTFRRAKQPPDWWGSNIDTGNLYTEVTTYPGPVVVPAIPLPTWITWKKEFRSWMATVDGVRVRRTSYVETLTQPDYYVETAKFPVTDTSWFELAVVAYSASIRPVAASVFRSLILDRRPGESGATPR